MDPGNERQSWPFMMQRNILRVRDTPRDRVDGQSLVEEESADEHVVERRERRHRARKKRRLGGGTQTTGCAYETNGPILDRGLAACGEAATSPLKWGLSRAFVPNLIGDLRRAWFSLAQNALRHWLLLGAIFRFWTAMNGSKRLDLARLPSRGRTAAI
jgi:hypothetical protein